MEGLQHKYYESQTPHFFKIVLHETLQSRKLSFPKSFIRHHGRSLCLSKVYLRVTSGDVWEVELHREEDGGMWLHNGWQEFLEFYNIKFGYFLVFGYRGHSEFQVLIFDKTTSEIEYPCKAKNNKEHNAGFDPCLLCVKPEIEEGDTKMAIDHAACQINASNYIFSNNRKKNTNRLVKISGDDDYVNGEGFSPCKSRKEPEAIIRDRAFNSPNPYFQIIMRASYVNFSDLRLPGRFIMDYIGQKECYPKLFVPCGRFWTVKCHFRMCGNQPKARIQLGWKTFVQDNNLAAGDVCIFELIDSVKVHFQVTIFRAAEERNLSNIAVKLEIGECIGRWNLLKPPCHEEPNSNIQYAATSNHTSKYPSFILVMTEARLKRGSVPIQTGFLKHLNRRTQIVTLQFAGRLWCVKVCFCQQFTRGILSRGWTRFARDNSLQVGDICLFELIEKEKMVLKFSIQRGSE